MKLRYTKSLAELVARWATGLINAPTGTQYLRATKTAIFSGENKVPTPPMKMALAIWAKGHHGTVALLRKEKTSYIIHHNHKNLVAWNLHKAGIEVIEVEDFNITKTMEIIKSNIANLQKKFQKTKKLAPLLALQIQMEETRLSKCKNLSLFPKK